MIVARLRGGVGNQMFQYAAGRALALRHGVALQLDVSACQERKDRLFALEAFSIDAKIAMPAQVEAWLDRERLLKRFLRKLAKARRLAPVVEQGFQFDPGFSALPDDVYLDGYWQSELYFTECGGQIRREFMLREPLTGRNAELAARIADCTAVALHVRRGDYVRDTKTGAWHGVCPVEYYRQCIERIKTHCEKPAFFLFSDDLPWAAANLPLPGETVVVEGNEGHRAVLDLHLMSLCRHHVIANSSFSWWGAWLAEAPGQIVMAPDPWFRTQELDAKDLIPARWDRVAFAT